MFRCRNDQKVLYTVISLVTIAVMNYLIFCKPAPKVQPHQKPVVANSKHLAAFHDQGSQVSVLVRSS